MNTYLYLIICKTFIIHTGASTGTVEPQAFCINNVPLVQDRHETIRYAD